MDLPRCAVPGSRTRSRARISTGYPECSFIDGHGGGYDYVRHAAEGFLVPAAEAGNPEIEAEP